nr:MAG TPA: hypothetical protein [Caudoviricetes sp.]
MRDLFTVSVAVACSNRYPADNVNITIPAVNARIVKFGFNTFKDHLQIAISALVNFTVVSVLDCFYCCCCFHDF